MTKQKPQLEEKQITDFQPDPHNANEGTARGRYMLEESVERVGYTEPMVASADGVILSGNKRQEVCVDKDLTDAIVIHSDGTRPVVHVRDDVQSGTKEAAEIAIMANRAAEVGLQWNAEALEWAMEEIDIDLGEMFWEHELENLGLKNLDNVEFPEYDESVANTVEMVKCPHCGKEFPK